MVKSLVRSIPLASVFVLTSLCLTAQEKSYTDYYFEAKALTDSLKTYQILVQAHGNTYPFVSNEYVKNEVGKSFNFLNNKERVDKDPEFVITIIVSDVVAKADYLYKGKNGESDNYDISLIYDVSFALSFEVNERDSVYVQLCNKKHYEKRVPYSRRNPEYIPSHRFTIPTPADKTIDQYVREIENTLNTKFSFLLDFNEVLVKFRKKK